MDKLSPPSSPFGTAADPDTKLNIAAKDGSKRFCVNYRHRNSVTIPSIYPLHLIDDILAKIGGSKYFSTTDLRSGYFQVAMDPASCEKTTFVIE